MHSPPFKKSTSYSEHLGSQLTSQHCHKLILPPFFADDILYIDIMAVKVEAVPVFLFIIGLVC